MERASGFPGRKAVKINNKPLGEAADASSAEGTAWSELRKLLLAAVVLVVVIYLAIGLIVDAAVARISFAKEAEWAKALPFPWRDSQDDDPRLARAREVLDKLIADSAVPPLNYQLKLIDSDEVNAFAFPGGTIGVTPGLLDALDAEIALAFVLGHELGHFQHRDHLRGLGRALGAGAAYAILFGGQMGSDTLGNISTFVLQRGYSRRQEERADAYGVALVFRIYGRTEGIERLFQLLDDEDDLPAWAYMFATHPSPNRRVRELRAYAGKLAQ
jgi:Zn-dependent protease with chaperone function